MTHYLRADGTAADAYLTLNLAGIDEVDVQYDIVVTDALVNDLIAAGGGGKTAKFHTVSDETTAGTDVEALQGYHSTVMRWNEQLWASYVNSFTAGTYTVSSHIKISTDELDFNIAGSGHSQDGGGLLAAASNNQHDLLKIGAVQSPATAGQIVFITNVKVGTGGVGSSDLMDEDFSGGGDFPLWTDSFGAVTIVTAFDPLPPPDPFPYWTVEHYQHEYVPDGPASSTLEADGSLIQIVRPENLHFVLQLGELGPGTIDYEISINAVDGPSNDPVVTEEFVGPYRTDFLLKRSDLDDPLMGGMHTEITGQDGDTPLDAVKIAGKDWLHYLERRRWPYDATLSYLDWPDGFRFKVAAGEVGQIVKDILETVRDLSANYPAAPDVLGPNPSYSLGFTVDADDTGFTINYEISNFDATSIYAMVQTLSQMGLTRGGFDFYMTWDKTFRLVYPEIGVPASHVFTLEVDATSFIPNMLSLGFTNEGPQATHMLGVGAGTANQQGGINKHFPASSAVFRRLDDIADFGDVKNLDTLESLTSLALAFGSNPLHTIPIEVDPKDIFNFWNVATPGAYVLVIYDLGFHQINSTQKIVSMDCLVDTEGNEVVTLGFNQFYDASDDSGIGDW